jgi:hypothetical protein
MARRRGVHSGELRARIADEAARLIQEGGLRDFADARRKAAQRLGIQDDAVLPRNSDIEAALRERLALFAGDRQPIRLRQLRVAAIEAMEFLARYQPRMVGAVLDGTADDHSAVCLHVFTDDVDAVGHFLSDHGIPFDREDRRLRIDPRREATAPAYLFVAGDASFDVVTLPLDGLRQAPLDRNGHQPMARASLARVRLLLDDGMSSD